MTTDELRAAADVLGDLHQRFAPLFGRREARERSLVYLKGLLLGEERKSAEPLALAFGSGEGREENRVLGLQRFLSRSPWEALRGSSRRALTSGRSSSCDRCPSWSGP